MGTYTGRSQQAHSESAIMLPFVDGFTLRALWIVKSKH